MSLWERLFGKKDEDVDTDFEKTKVYGSLDKNFKAIKDILVDCDDVLYREIKIGVEGNYRAVIISIDGMTDKDILNDYVLKNLMVNSRIAPPDIGILKRHMSDVIKVKCLVILINYIGIVIKDIIFI